MDGIKITSAIKKSSKMDYAAIEADVRAACDGDGEKRAALLETFTPLIARLALRYGRENPEDAFQDGCIDFLNALDHFDKAHAVTFPAFIRRRLESRFINRLRKAQISCISLETSNQETGQTLSESLPDPSGVDLAERYNLREVLSVLTKNPSSVLRLQYGEGLSIEEIAKRLKKNRSTIFRYRTKEIAYLREQFGVVEEGDKLE